VIRLRGPWKQESHCVGARGTRHFNCPTNLGPGERVWLVCDATEGEARFALNGKSLFTLSGSAAARHDITEHLKPHNVLTVEVLESIEQMAKKPAASACQSEPIGGPFEMILGTLVNSVRLEIGPRET